MVMKSVLRRLALSRSVREARQDHIQRMRIKRKRRELIKRTARKAVTEVLLPATLGMALGLFLIYAFISVPQEVPAYEDMRFQAWNGLYYTPTEYEQMMEERQAYLESEAAENRAFWEDIWKAQERAQEEERQKALALMGGGLE